MNYAKKLFNIIAFIPALAFLPLNACQAQKVRPAINVICDKMAAHNVLESKYVGVGGVIAQQWKLYETLSKDATTAELIRLTDHKNGVVRGYSFQALADRKGVDLMPVIRRHLHDIDEIQTLTGCLGGTQFVGDYFLSVVGEDHLNPRQQAQIDSILIFDRDMKLQAKYSLLGSIKPKKSYYSRIQEIAMTETRPEAYLALARYQNPKDVLFLQSLFKRESAEYYGIYAVREFPHASFYPILQKVFEKEWGKQLFDHPKWRILYQALAKYPNSSTYALFKKTVDEKDAYRHETLCKYLMIAITKYPNAIFEPLKSQIKLEGGYEDFEMDIEE